MSISIMRINSMDLLIITENEEKNNMKKKTLDWVEKYRPSNLKEIIGNSKAIAQLQSWAKLWARGRPRKKGVILIGSPGIGKTSAAYALASEHNWDLIELNASDKRNASSIEKIIGHGSRADAFSLDGTYYSSAEGRLKLIIFDEADNLFGREDYGGAKAIVQSLRKTAQPIILIVNDYYELTRRASGIKQLALSIRFEKLTAHQVMEALERIAGKEKVNISQEALHNIARNCGGDIRAAINDLQSISTLDRDDMEKITGSLGWRDVPPEIFESLEKILTSNDPLEARRFLISVGEPPDKFIIWLDDNLPRIIRNVKDRENALWALSRADIFLGRVSRRQYYRFWSYATDLMSMGVCQAAGDRYKTYSGSLRFPEYLIKLSRTKARRASLKSLLKKLARESHTSSSIAREAIVPYIRSLTIRDREFAIELSKRLELLPGEIALLLGIESDSDDVEQILSAASGNNEEQIDADNINQQDEKKKRSIEYAQQRSLFEFQ